MRTVPLGLMSVVAAIAFGAGYAPATSYDCIKGKDFYCHGDLSNLALHSVDDCQDACSVDVRCNALAFNRGRCYLKAVVQQDVQTKIINHNDVITCVLAAQRTASNQEKLVKQRGNHN
ncbi:hypothetical protein AaE_006488 [Aphanomyces astaci]|uniref:Apple domain-containing protein n=1 Tax=Aphanomyces astaci TaxID=112090 RepID=A0A6A5A558_APHAT|nr:hypothetical protein AaE_006488 [Aphanomyces astaci]